jgi:TRAP-type mannitol/chloroaromatic compound transport system permease small subunit
MDKVQNLVIPVIYAESHRTHSENMGVFLSILIYLLPHVTSVVYVSTPVRTRSIDQ